MINERSAILTRELDDGRVIDVIPLLGGRARIIISNDVAEKWYADGW